MEMVEMLVRMDCTGCERTIRKALSKMKGVDTVEVDLRQSKVTVTGYVDRKKVLKAVRNTGKRAEFWPQTPNYHYGGPQSYMNYHSQGQLYSQPFARTYNYEKHGYNNMNLPMDGTSSGASTSQEGSLTTMFSDENPNACSIM